MAVVCGPILQVLDGWSDGGLTEYLKKESWGGRGNQAEAHKYIPLYNHQSSLPTSINSLYF